MRRLLLSLIVLAAALPARGESIRFPKLGAHAFQVELPRGWKSTADKRGGLLLVSPDNHAMIYLSILTGEQFRGRPESAVAGDVAKLAGISQIEAQAPAQIADLKGTAYFGELREKKGYARKAKIVLVRLAPDVWAQQWIVTQAGMNAVERAALERALAGISLLRD
jgi:hypothetical protein